MNITVIYGTERIGCTYHIAQEVISRIHNAEVTEFFLPRDCPEYCTSCFRCFTDDTGVCSQSSHVPPILNALLRADLIVLTSPVYSYHVSGQMKVLLDHFANMWMVHRPRTEMFTKLGLVIATASGPVYRQTLHEMKDSLDFWGVSRTYQLGAALMETRWDHLSGKTRASIIKKAQKAAGKIMPAYGRTSPCFRVRKWFFLSRFMQRHIKMNPADVAYWNRMGWCGKVRPWKEDISN